MIVNAQDIVDSVDLNRNEVLLPIYESVVNSIISLCKTNQLNKKIDIFIERNKVIELTTEVVESKIGTIKNVTIVDNGEGFTETNFQSFQQPFSKCNKKYGCKGVGRFTMLALFNQMKVVSIYTENNQWYKRSFTFDATTEISEHTLIALDGEHHPMTKVMLLNCNNKQLLPYTAKNMQEIANGLLEHCFIYYLSEELPEISINEEKEENSWEGISVNSLFNIVAREKEKEFTIRNNFFKMYVVTSDQITSRKYNYIALCANSRKVGRKRDLAKVDSLYAYPITDDGKSKFLDVYVVSPYLDAHVNNQRTGFKIPEKDEWQDGLFEVDSTEVSMEEILQRVASELSYLYETYAKATKERNIAEVTDFIRNSAPQYSSFLYRRDILDAMPPNLSDEKKDEYLHKISYQENVKITEKIDEFIKTKTVNEEQIEKIIHTIQTTTAYNTDSLVQYVCRRKAIIRLFSRMLDQKEDGKYELEKMIHNIIFPMGLTNRELTYQYHNLWLLDDRFSTYRFIASDKAITSFSQIKSSKEPDLILINNEKDLINNPISFGNKDAGEISSMVIFEFKRPGDTAHQKKNNDYRWEFSELVKDYFEEFLFGKEKKKKNYRGNVVTITRDTPKFGYVIMDEMPKELIDYNESNGWRKTPFGSYYKIIPEQNLHIEAITFQNLLNNAKERNNPFFDHLFANNIDY